MDLGWQILLIFYYFVKNYVLTRIKLYNFQNSSFIYSLILSALAILINQELVRVYESTDSNGIIKGIVWLPSITLIFIAADLLSSIIIFTLFNKIDLSKSRKLNIPIIGNIAAVFELNRLILLGITFYFITTIFWSQSVIKFNISEYDCFRNILKRDIIIYYHENNSFPSDLNVAKTFTINPSNGSQLYTEFENDGTIYYIKDLQGNVIIDSPKHIIPQIDNYELREKYLNTLSFTLKDRCSE